MDRRRLLISVGIPLVTSLAGCLGDDQVDQGQNNGDEFPDKVEVELTGEVREEKDISLDIELANPVVTEISDPELVTLRLTNNTVKTLKAKDSAELFPSEFVLEPTEDNSGTRVRLSREDGNPTEEIPPGETRSTEYSFTLHDWLIGRPFAGEERIELCCTEKDWSFIMYLDFIVDVMET